MTNQQRTFWDDLLDIAQEIFRRLDEMLHPEKKRKPVRVPVPVRANEAQENPYDRH